MLDGKPEAGELALAQPQASRPVLWDLLEGGPQAAQALLLLLGSADSAASEAGLCRKHWWTSFKRHCELCGALLRPQGQSMPSMGPLQTLRCPAELLGAELRLLV